MTNLLSSLSQSQKAAVEYIDGPELVIAGAGSGKTRVLTYKIAYLISQGYEPWRILALTFTNKAAREMKERIGGLMGMDVARYLNMGTFHSIFLRILHVEAEKVGLKSNFTVYDDSDSRTLVSGIVKEMGLDDKKYKPSAVLSRISMAKNRLISPEAYLSDGSILESDIRSSMPKVGEIYHRYMLRCRMANAVDFDDMLYYTYFLLSKNKDICVKYAERFRYVLVDEYQDTNYAQQAIITLLTRDSGKICVVGDDAQSIYAFRGANIDNILNFRNVYQGAKLFKLERNYRSTQNIVEAANCLIAHNQRQIPKNVYSENLEGDKVQLDITYSDREEVSVVCNNIRRLHLREQVAYSDMAILYRTNAQSRLFEDELLHARIPYRIYGGLSFYQRKEIKDIIAYFRLVANPDDDEALKRIINYPKRGIGNVTVDKISAAAHDRNISLWDVTADPLGSGTGLAAATSRKVSDFHKFIQGFMDDMAEKDAYQLGKRIIEESGISQTIVSEADDDKIKKEKMENVEELVSGLRDFVDTKREEGLLESVSLSHFLQEVSLLTDLDRDGKGDEALEDNSDEGRVSLMTVHASKGLEFDSVFVVGLEENLFPSARALESLRELEEERRLLYVAMTRAERHCFLTCAKSRYQYGNMQFNTPSRFLREIDSHLMNVNGKLPGRESREYATSPTSLRGFDSPLRRTNPAASSRLGMFCRQASPSDRQSPSSGFRRVSASSSQFPAASQSSAATEKHSLTVGSTIEHQRFGIGKVIKVEGVGENEKATVLFNNVGSKCLLLKFAKYKLM